MTNKSAERTWPQKPLCKIATVVKGKKPENFARTASSGVLPYLEATFLRRQGEPKHISLNDTNGLVLLDSTDTLILWDGANAGEVFRGETGVVASTMARVRAQSTEILPEFLYFCLLKFSSKLRETATGSTVPHVQGAIVGDLQIPLPPIAVQEHILQILQKADEVRRKRQKALELADAILSASFIGMFGDPGSSHDTHGCIPLGTIADVRSGVTKGRKLGDRDTVEVPYLRVANVQDGYLDLTEVKTIEVLPTDVERHHLEDGDILIIEGCGTPAYLGRGCIWRGEIDGCIHQNHVFRIRANRSRVLPEYLASLFRTKHANQYFLKSAKNSSGLYNINGTQVKAFPVPLPSIKLQEKFVTAVEQWVQASERLAGGLKDAGRLFASLMEQAFSGNLTSKWEAVNADWIMNQIDLHVRLPRLVLLALVRERAVRVGKCAHAGVMVTDLMSYAFLLQAEGNGRRRYYRFEPAPGGPFATDVYADLERLTAAGLVSVASDTEQDMTWISLVEPSQVEAALAELPDDLQEDVVAIFDAYGDRDRNSLLKILCERFPAYGKKCRVNKKDKASPKKGSPGRRAKK